MSDQNVSMEKCIEIGSPQGSIISPLLFIIYVADMELWLEKCKSSGYADDTCLFITDRNLNRLKEDLENDAYNMLTFMASNNLVTNAEKTEIILVRSKMASKKPQTLRIGSATVTESNQAKLLGLTVTNKLTSCKSWKWHLGKE